MGLFDRFRKKKQQQTVAVSGSIQDTERAVPGQTLFEEKPQPEEAAASGPIISEPVSEEPAIIRPVISGVADSDSVDSISLSLSKGSVLEKTEIQDKPGAGIAGQEDSLSNEEIKKGDSVLDTYKVLYDPVKGGMGSVWKVHHNSWNTDLAMKRPKPKFFAQGSEKRKEKFIHECEAWINLGLHPNIVSCYYVREIGGVPTIFSEWMENGSLKNRMEDGSLYDIPDKDSSTDKPLTEEDQRKLQARLLDIAIQFARGLHYAHESEGHLIHQDVKPDNLLLTKDWEAKVADFGLAHAREQLKDTNHADSDLVSKGNRNKSAGSFDTGSKVSDISGDDLPEEATHLAPTGGYTPAYCSFEQYLGQPLTRRTDIYSWAVSVLEMYVGGRKWRNGREAGSRCEEFFEQSRVFMPDSLKELLKSCLAENPESRPHDFAVVEEALKKVYREMCGEEYPRSLSEAAADTAQSLNNRALSYLDLGKTKEAETLWAKALEKTPDHLPTLYNQGLYEWRLGRIDDEEVIRRLKQDTGGNSSRSAQLMKQLDKERGIRADKTTSFEKIGSFTGGPALAMTKDQRSVVTAKGYLEKWNLETKQRQYFVKKNSCFSEHLALTPDGRLALYADDLKKTLEVSEVQTGRHRFSLAGHAAGIWAICAHPSGKYAYSGGADKTIRRWNLETGECEHVYEITNSTGITAIAVSPDGSRLYYSGISLSVINEESQSHEFFPGRRPTPTSLCISPDGKTLYGGVPGGVCFFNTEDLSFETVAAGEAKRKTMVAVSENGKYLISGNDDGDVKLWDTEKRKVLTTLFGHKMSISGLAVNDAASMAVTTSFDKTCRIWYLQQKETAPWELCMAKEYKKVVSAQEVWKQNAEKAQECFRRGNYREMEAWVKTLKDTREDGDLSVLRSLQRQLSSVCGKKSLLSAFELFQVKADASGGAVRAALSPDGNLCVTGGIRQKEHVISMWDMKTSAKIRSYPYQVLKDLFYGLGVSRLAFSPDQTKIAVALNDNTIRIYEILKEEESLVLRGPMMQQIHGMDEVVKDIAFSFSPDGRYIVGADHYIQSVHQWDLESGEILWSFDPPKSVWDVVYSPEGEKIAAAGDDGTVWILDREGRLLSESMVPEMMLEKVIFKDGKISKKKDPVYMMNIRCVRFSPDGKKLYTAHADGYIGVWETENMVYQTRFQPDREAYADVHNMCLSADGHFLASAGSRSEVILWDLEMKKRAGVLNLYHSRAEDLCFGPDDVSMITSGGPNLTLWGLDWEWELPEAGEESGKE